MRFRTGVLASLFAAITSTAALAQDEGFTEAEAFLKGRPYYVSPVISYGLADKDRGTDDGIGGSVSVGKKVASGLTLELIGSFMRMDADPGSGLADNGSFELYGAGIGATIFPLTSLPNFYARLNLMHGSGQGHPGLIENYDTTIFDSGLGYLFPITSRIALRAEALYRVDAHNRRSAGIQPKDNRDFYDGVFSLGALIPLGTPPRSEPEDPDSDGDGVPDSLDQCPGTPPGVEVDATGCEPDSDGDGVPDRLDQCPDTPQGVVVDGKGCPVDSDGDGIPDHLDECPNSPAGAKVLDNGCALFGDCRRPRPGEAVDEKGCAVDQSFILKGVKFEFDSDRLTEEAKQILNKVAETLIAYPEIDVEVAGHTDQIGTEGYNLGLSERRAIVVKNYLADRGVQAARMSPVGYGRSQPIADNSTEEGREENRRVELRPSTDL
jgi:OmpA-OmpF porin, OOP family